MILKPPLGIRPNWGQPLAKGIGAHWLFNECPPLLGMANDLSGNGNHATLIGNTHLVPGLTGPALKFDGVDDYVDCGSIWNFDGGSPFSAFGWVCTAATGNQYLFGSGFSDGWYLRLSSGAALRAKIDDGVNDAHDVVACAINNSSWHQAGIVLTETRLWTIFDGQIILDIDNGSVGDLADTVYVGWAPGGSTSDRWNGLIDNVVIYNRALSPKEVGQLYREPFKMFEVDL